MCGTPHGIMESRVCGCDFSSDGPTIHTRETLQSIASMAPNTAQVTTSNHLDLAGHESSSTATLATPTTTNKPVSPVLPRKSDRVTQPAERYSPGLFFTESDEPTSYKKAIRSEEFPTWQLAMKSEMTSIYENQT